MSKESFIDPASLSPDMFVSIGGDEAIDELLSDVAKRKEDIWAQTGSDKPLHLKAEQYNEKSLYCEGRAYRQEGEVFHLQFSNKGELYFAKAKLLHYEKDLCRFERPTEILKLQRRQSYRVRLPRKDDVALLLDPPYSAKLPLVDLSAGGLRAVVPRALDLQPGTSLSGTLYLGAAGGPLDIKLIVRRLESENGEKVLGFQILDPSQKVEMRLLSYVMKVFRQYYARPKDREDIGGE